MNEKVNRNKIYVSSPTSISIGYNTWFALDTKLVGRIKKLINDCEEKDKEIERLNNKIKEQSLLLIEFQDMEQRLKEKDDIIDGLEKFFVELNLEKLTSFDDYMLGEYSAYKNVFKKLKELKGEN